MYNSLINKKINKYSMTPTSRGFDNNLTNKSYDFDK